MSDGASPVKPGYKTTEFWLVLLANVVGAVLASGLFQEDSPAMKALGVAAMVLTTLGYTVKRSGVKSAAKLLIVAMLPVLALGCTKGMIRASAVDGLIEDVTARHDKMLRGELDPVDLNGDKVVDDKDKALKEAYLRSSKMLNVVVDEALEKPSAPSQ